MKQTFFLTVAALFVLCVLSCSDDSERVKTSPVTSQLQPTGRSLGEALRIAEEAVGVLGESGVPTRGITPSRRIRRDDIRAVCSNATTRAAGGLDTLMYVFNFEDSLGFAVISASRATPGLLAIAESGYYNPYEEQPNDAFEMIMESAAHYVANSLALDSTFFLIKDTMLEVSYMSLPLVSVKWGQGHLYGELCPNHIAGCGATAVAQALTYFGNIDTLDITYNGRDVERQPLDWGDIKKHILYYTQNGNESSQYCAATDSAHCAISRLCRQLGEIMNSDYTNPHSTGTYTNQVVNCFKTLGFPATIHYENYSKGSTIAPLKNNHVLLFFGRRYGTTSGHFWLVDGLQTLGLKVRNPETFLWNTTYYDYNHVNWGWDGRSNGYYLDEIFDTSRCSMSDFCPYGKVTGYNYTELLKFVDLYLE